MSVQITDTHPRLSTAFRSLIIACSLAIFWVPMAWTMVTMEPSASGMAATASATANIRESSMAIPRYILSTNTTRHITIIAAARRLENWSRLTWRGVFFSSAPLIIEAMRPISVSMPVPVTATMPLPPVIREPL